jgi:BirA family biotin operon repressor/biotin-[acetyl-CoA-carboxylase] ligase
MTKTRTDLDIKLLECALSNCDVGRCIFHYEVLGSTMDEARRLAEGGADEGAVVIAEEQTAGRGRFNRAWISPRGQNLSFSVLLRPTQAQMPYVNMAATLAVSRTVARATGLSPTIKWPNDVRVGGRKISGILIEAAIEGGEVSHAIVGIGLNVNFDPSVFPEIADISTSLFRETGRPHGRTQVLQHLLEEFDTLYSTVRAGRSLTNQWSGQLETLGRTVRLAWQDNIVEGKAEAVDDQGNLILKLPDGSKFTALAGEVTLQV